MRRERSKAECRRVCALVAAGVAALVLPMSSVAQGTPTVRTVLTGYGAVGYGTTVGAGDTDNNFNGFISLVPLAQIEENVLIEAEVELELEGSATNVVLEHVEAHYLGFDRWQVTAGKFHLPIGVWSHSNWTNKMPTPPLLYQDTHGDAASEALMPIPFDLGVKATWTIPITEGWRTSATAWASQGPTGTFGGGHTHETGEEDDHTHDEGAQPDAPLMQIGANYEDNNSDKMLGLRFRAASMGGLTVQASAFRGAYDDAGSLDLRGANLGVVWTPASGSRRPLELKGEVTWLEEEYAHDGAEETVDLSGYYLQASRRFGDWEPVARWSQLSRTVAGEGILIPRRRQLALGLNYWISPSVPVKVAYHMEPDGTDGLFIEWAMGF